MRSIFTICTFAIVAIVGTSGHVLSLTKNAEIYSTKEYLVRAIASNFMDRLVNEVRNMNNTLGEEMMMATILPPFPDPVIIPPTNIPVDINLDFVNPPLTIAGNVETKSNLEITGLNGMQDKFEFNIGDRRLSWDVTIPTISVSADDYNVELEIKEGATVSHNVAGGGALAGSVSTVVLKLAAQFKLTGNLGLTSLSFDVGFSNLAIDGGDATFDGEPIVWAEVSKTVQEWFESTWNSDAKAVIVEAVRCSVDSFINQCTIDDLTTGNFECLNDQIDPACLTPTTGTTPIQTTTSGAIAPIFKSFLVLTLGFVILIFN